MKQLRLNLDQMNEADVREEFLAPLLDHLGYQSGGDGHVSRERTLSVRYPRIFLGRKKPRTDPYLRGRADYVLEVKGHARWVLEAKPPSDDITEDSIEQAWSYANHAEVRAVYFAISNGRKFLIFRTSAPPRSGPILALNYEDLANDITSVERILNVEAIKRDFVDACDMGDPIADGFGSIGKIVNVNGVIRYTKSSLELPAINELQVSIIDGSVERGEDGNLIASVMVRAPVKSIHEMIERLGLSRLHYLSKSRTISQDRSDPTEFSYEGRAVFPEGEVLFDANSGSYVKLEHSIECEITSLVKAYAVRGGILGTIENIATYLDPFDLKFSFSGEVEMRVL